MHPNFSIDNRKSQPKQVPFSYVGPDKLNNFQASPFANRRYISETYKAGDRNHKIPTTSSPIMMTSGVSATHRFKEANKTVNKLHSFR